MPKVKGKVYCQPRLLPSGLSTRLFFTLHKPPGPRHSLVTTGDLLEVELGIKGSKRRAEYGLVEVGELQFLVSIDRWTARGPEISINDYFRSIAQGHMRESSFGLFSQ